MIAARVRVRTNQTRIRAQMTTTTIRFVDDVCEAVAARGQVLAPRHRGRLADSIHAEVARPVSVSRVQGRVVADARHAIWQHEGTGIYGPRGRRIRPKRARVLRFFWRKVGRVVFFRSVRGTPATKYLTKALDEVLSQPPWVIRAFTRLR